MPQVLCRGEFQIDRLGLKNHSNPSANLIRLLGGVKTRNQCAAARRQHERGKNPEQCCLAAAVRAKQPKDFARCYIERNAFECRALAIAVAYIFNTYC